MAELKYRYASALFKLAMEKGTLEEQMQQAAFVVDVLETDKCEDFLLHPHIPNSAKCELLSSLFAGKISEDLMGFLYLAVNKSREAIILPALASFMDMVEKHSGKAAACVVSAAPLGEEQVLALGRLLTRKLGREVEIQIQVDPALIGGFYVHVEGRLIDQTVRARLTNMKESLKRGGTE
ncbi:MAG TPA: ATP synthase F1 subunit delta [Clostridiales bacterium]|jgi:F-type H+-transporting ATPase subunit delta|nr:ATP synthase F1 subunit delta [Clostridiales bacterium]